MAKISRVGGGRRALTRPLAATLGFFLLSPASLTQILFQSEAPNGVVSVCASNINAEGEATVASPEERDELGQTLPHDDNVNEAGESAQDGIDAVDVEDIVDAFGGENGVLGLTDLFRDAGDSNDINDALEAVLGGGDASPEEPPFPSDLEAVPEPETVQPEDVSERETAQPEDVSEPETVGAEPSQFGSEAAGEPQVPELAGETQVPTTLPLSDDNTSLTTETENAVGVEGDATTMGGLATFPTEENNVQPQEEVVNGNDNHAKTVPPVHRPAKGSMMKKVGALLATLLAMGGLAYAGHKFLRGQSSDAESQQLAVGEKKH
ncbi:UNVERIFIED_CONTAM: hypothetical protein HHA_277230 [Hammondia hammondi]|eukprot:XP_008888556.1 hypothetical protein HHA_277230 [Hammondia hammondi]